MQVPEKQMWVQASEGQVQVLEKKVHAPETQGESSSRVSLKIQRETLHPKKSVWSVGSKGS